MYLAGKVAIKPSLSYWDNRRWANWVKIPSSQSGGMFVASAAFSPDGLFVFSLKWDTQRRNSAISDAAPPNSDQEWAGRHFGGNRHDSFHTHVGDAELLSWCQIIFSWRSMKVRQEKVTFPVFGCLICIQRSKSKGKCSKWLFIGNMNSSFILIRSRCIPPSGIRTHHWC